MLLLKKVEELTLHLIKQNDQTIKLQEASAQMMEEMTLQIIELKEQLAHQQREMEKLMK